MPNVPLRDWHAKDPASAAHWQEAVAFLRKLGGDKLHDSDQHFGIEHRIGIVSSPPEGQAEYTDSRYWVRFAIPGEGLATAINSARAIGKRTYELPDETTADETEYLTVTNLGESGTHALRIGRIVPMFAIWDASATAPTKHWFMSESVAGVFPVLVTQDGGAQGTKTATATWTYTVTDLALSELGTAVALSRPRPYGRAIHQAALGYGLAFYSGATLILWDAGEVYGTGACPDPP